MRTAYPAQATKFMSFPDMGVQLWLTFDHGAEVYEVWTDDTCQSHIGCADSIAEARGIGHDYFAELMQ